MTSTVPPQQPTRRPDATGPAVSTAAPDDATSAMTIVPQQRSAPFVPGATQAPASGPGSVRISGLVPSAPAHAARPGAGLIGAVAAGVLAILGIAAAIAIGFATTGTSPAPVATPVAPPAPSTSQLLAQWRDGGGLQHLTTISGDLTSVGEAASRYDVSGMMSACYSLQNDIESAQAFTPVPDVQVQSSWSAALASGARSAAYCVAGAQQLDPDLINMSTSEMNDMTSHLNDATARLNSINGI